MQENSTTNNRMDELTTENVELTSQITRASLEIEHLSSTLTKTMEESQYHANKSTALTSAELKINELSLTLSKTKGMTINISKEIDWFKSENSTLTRDLDTMTVSQPKANGASIAKWI